MSEPTVRDIEWHVNPNYRGGFVFAEDQYILSGGQYAEQVCEEHNTCSALRRQLAEREERIAALNKALLDIEQHAYERSWSHTDYQVRASEALAGSQQGPPAQLAQSSEEEE